MKKSGIKTIVTLFVLISVCLTCIVSASASLSSTLNVYWNARETEAWLENVCDGPYGVNYWAYAYIKSNSTDIWKEAWAYSNGINTTITATTDHVPVSYPSPIPLIDYWGNHGTME